MAGVLAGWAVAGPLDRTGRALVALVATAFGALGLVDDLRGVPALRRLVIQCVLASAALGWLLDGIAGPRWWRIAVACTVAVWIVGYVNAFNFMDGINGIAAVQVVVAGSTWAVIGRTEGVPVLTAAAAAAAAAAAGFLPFNFPRARVFLGDVGSYFLGGWLAVVAVVGMREGVPPEAMLAPLAVFLADTASTLVQRVRRGERWYEAHRDHVYQRLTRRGWSHARTTVAAGAAMLLCAVLGSVSLGGAVAWRVAADAAALGVLALYLAAPTLLGRMQPTGA